MMNITQKVLCCQRGYWSLGSVVHDIQQYCINWLITQWGWNYEDASDFFSYMQPRIIRTLRTYTFSGKSYLRYLRRMMHFQIKSYIKEQKLDQDIQGRISSLFQDNYHVSYDGHRRLVGVQYGAWPESENVSFPPEQPDDAAFCRESPPKLIQKQGENAPLDEEYFEDHIRNLPVRHKRILIHILRKPESLHDDLISKLSKHIGIPTVYILALRQQAFSDIEHKLTLRDIRRDRRTRKYVRLRFNTEEEDARKNLEDYLAKSLQTVRRMNVNPSHRDLAHMTGIPKGTIGSYFYTKNRNASMKEGDSTHDTAGK
ncbi:MAG: hypothetical protein ACR2PY_06515 [Salinispira sp.]